MKKVQKIWLSVFLAMFLVPEILWSPAYKMYLATFSPSQNGHYAVFRANLLDNSNGISLWANLLLLQFLGVLFLTTFFLFLKKYFQNKNIFWVVFLFLLALTLVMFYIHGFSTLKITF